MSSGRILVADDEPSVRESVGYALGQEGFEVTIATDGDDADEKLGDGEVPFDLLVLDIMMPGRSGLSIIKELRRIEPRARILVLSAHGAHDFVRQALSAGARGYALKSSRLAELLLAIQTVASGGVYLAPGLPRWMLDDARAPEGADGPLTTLSPREREVFDLVVRGYSTNGIAGTLFISVKTVETHRAHINRKLGVHSSADLLRLAARHGILAEG